MAVYPLLAFLVPLILLPVNLAIWLLLAALFLFLLRKRTASKRVFIAALIVLYVASLPAVARPLVSGLERDFPPPDPVVMPRYRCLVLLGGIVSSVDRKDGEVNINESRHRLEAARLLLLSGKVATGIISSGARLNRELARAEARYLADLLIRDGIAPDRLVIEAESRNTRQNAVFTAPLIRKMNCGPTLLVTTASHMKRASAAFQRAGVDVEPFPTGHRLAELHSPALFGLLPSTRALVLTNNALKEWMGFWAYRFKGWV